MGVSNQLSRSDEVDGSVEGGGPWGWWQVETQLSSLFKCSQYRRGWVSSSITITLSMSN